MGKRLAEFLLGLSGWRLNPSVPEEVGHCIIIAAPHTSNWDIYYARLGFYVMGVPLKFTIKREWMRFPLNLIIGPLGGLAIDRLQAKAPICLGYLDYVKKEAGVGGTVYPSGDIEADLKKIMDFYKDISGKHPEQFALDQRYIR